MILGIEEIAKMPDDKEELIEGQIYVTKEGQIKKHKKGKFYKPGEKGF